MRKQLSKIALTAGFVLAISFTLSCSSDNDDGDKSGGSAAGGGGSGVTVKIGTQTWMKKNLDVAASGSKCYGDDPANCVKYGRLYDWATAMNLPASCNSSSCASQIQAKHRGICPEGWHIPSGADWNALMKVANPSCLDNSDCAGAGTKLKATSGWNNSGNGTDDYGFSALPGGLGYSDGYFSYAGYNGDWWSATEYSSNNAYNRDMYYDYEYAYWDYYSKVSLFSVRCLQD
jgi:uncharacterized protein (TIGR02145 family)